MFVGTKIKSALITLLACCLGLALVSCAHVKQQELEEIQERFTFSSPDNRIRVLISWDTSLSPQYSVTFDDKPVLLPSNVNLVYKGTDLVEHDLRLLSETSINTTSTLPWGQFSQTQNRHNAVKFELVDKVTQEVLSIVEFKAFNDALALRHIFETPEKPLTGILTENTDFTFASDVAVWSYNGMKPTERTRNLGTSDSKQLLIPAMLQGDNLPAMAIQEASRLETAMIKLKTTQNKSQIAVVSEPIVRANAPASTSWRVLQIAEKPGDLITSQTLINLSPKSRIEDTSWIKTGKSFWDWRVRGEQYGSHTYALDNESLRRMIDFAAENNMQYVMIDANWYGPEHKVESDPFTEIEGLNIKGLINQANDKGIGFILYLNDKASVHHDLDKLFETWSSWGAAGVKYGFMKSKGKDKVLKTLNIVELAAKHQLLINFHDGPVIPSGLRRTWPNWVTREAVHAQADGRETFSPGGFVNMAHVNAIAGPLDMSNGFFKLNGLKESRKYVRTDVNSTVANEVARSLIIYSGLIIFPDAPEEYLRKKDLFEFLQRMPTTWDESRVLSSDIDKYIVTARRSNKDWFVGASIDEEGGNLPLKLDFLAAKQKYIAKIFADASDAHYLTNKEAYEIRTVTVQKGDVLDMKLAPGGGQAIWITPLTKGD